MNGFVGLANSSAITGLLVTDANIGLTTNVFTLDPRRYRLAIGFRF
jgi:iron complex outermembrane recepter protein